MILKHIKFDYDFSRFLNADYSSAGFTCIPYQRVEQADLHEKYAGKFPETFNDTNTILHQLWWNEDQIDFTEIGEQLGIEVKSISSIMQPPGNMITVHRDMFYKFRKEYPNETRPIVRANIYLNDWNFGHLLQYSDGKEWHNATHWKQGQGLLWDSDIIHLSCNAGLTEKYTLQISGFYNL